MSEELKVTEEELNSIKELQELYLRATYDLGSISLEKADLQEKLQAVEAQLRQAHAAILELRKKEEVISKQLFEKYGSSTVDLNTGIIQK